LTFEKRSLMLTSWRGYRFGRWRNGGISARRNKGIFGAMYQ
jgi:hypothetical protein